MVSTNDAKQQHLTINCDKIITFFVVCEFTIFFQKSNSTIKQNYERKINCYCSVYSRNLYDVDKGNPSYKNTQYTW